MARAEKMYDEYLDELGIPKMPTAELRGAL